MITLTLPHPLPGLPALSRFVLNQVWDSPGLYSLESSEVDEVKLFVLDPRVHLPDYKPSLKGVLGGIGNPDVETEAKVFVIVNTADAQPVVNLLAPLVVNTETLQAAQVVLDNQNYPVRAPLRMLSPA